MCHAHLFFVFTCKLRIAFQTDMQNANREPVPRLTDEKLTVDLESDRQKGRARYLDADGCQVWKPRLGMQTVTGAPPNAFQCILFQHICNRNQSMCKISAKSD